LLTSDQTAKNGILGLMRCLRSLPQTANIPINSICPWFVDIAVTAGIAVQWSTNKPPINQSVDIAKVIVGRCLREGAQRNAIYVGGTRLNEKENQLERLDVLTAINARAWEMEKSLKILELQWLEEDQSKELKRGNDFVGSGEFLTIVEERIASRSLSSCVPSLTDGVPREMSQLPSNYAVLNKLHTLIEWKSWAYLFYTGMVAWDVASRKYKNFEQTVCAIQESSCFTRALTWGERTLLDGTAYAQGGAAAAWQTGIRTAISTGFTSFCRYS
jgi:hypothetical protein